MSCSSGTDCTSIGSWSDADGPIRALAESWNGTSWALQHARNPAGLQMSELFGVSCAGALACVAVGHWSTSLNGIPSYTLAERWNGTAWRIRPTPNPEGATNSTLNSVCCSSADACVAVGSSYASGVTSDADRGLYPLMRAGGRSADGGRGGASEVG